MKSKVIVEFSELDAKSVAAVVAMLNGAKTTVKKTAKTEEEEEVEEEEEDLTGGEEEEEEVEEEQDAPPTLDRLKERANELIKAKKGEKLKAVLGKFKAAKVTEVKKADYAKFLAEMNKIK